MNYRHAFHAGNFADLLKHAVLTACLESLLPRAGAMVVVDTHAGAGAYDLRADEAVRSGEAEAGIGRLMADPDPPDAFEVLLAAVTRINAQPGALRFYPGSPMLIASALREDDRFWACEMRKEEHASLDDLLSSVAGASALHGDGFVEGVAKVAPDRAAFVLIDPPFERGDDYDRAADACGDILSRRGDATILIWLPLKDLETFDRFLRRLESVEVGDALVVECRLRPLDNPMAMNGCAMVVINAPGGVESQAAKASDWIVRHCGQRSGESRVWSL